MQMVWVGKCTRGWSTALGDLNVSVHIAHFSWEVRVPQVEYRYGCCFVEDIEMGQS